MVETSGTSKYSASAMAGWATSQSWACTTSGRQARCESRVFSASPARSHRMAHGQRPGHHVGAEVELVRVLCGGDHPHALGDLVGRRVRAGVGARGAAAEHHDLVAVRGQCRRQLIHVAAEPADHHRRVLPRHHQDLHRRTLVARERPQNATVSRRVGVQTRSLAGSGGVILAAAWRPGRRTGRRRGSSRRPTAGRARDGPTPARRRSRGWRARAGGRDNARSRRRSPC